MVGFGVGGVLSKKSIKQESDKKNIRRSVVDYDVIGGALTDMLLDEAKDFLQLLRSRPYQRKSKVFSNKELRIVDLVDILEEWNQHFNENVSQYDLVFQLKVVLTAIMNERKKKRVRLEVRTFELLKTSLLKCTEILAAKEAKEEKKEFGDIFEGEYRVEETVNDGDDVKEEEMNFEKICEKLYYHHCEQHRLLELIGRMKRF